VTRGERGFTLIEVLVAIGLLAFGMTLAVAALRSLVQSSGRAEITAQRDEHLRAVQALLRTQLSGALPISFHFDPDSGQTDQLVGRAEKLEFVAGMPGYLSRGGAYLQTLSLVPGSDGKQLVFEFRQLGPDGPLPAERAPKVLLDGIAEASFEYRTIDQQHQPGPWQAQWAQSGMLPPMLRLRLRFADPHRSWPDLVVAVRQGTASPPPSPDAPEPVDTDKSL
jgi:general secretion pathway protein J